MYKDRLIKIVECLKPYGLDKDISGFANFNDSQCDLFLVLCNKLDVAEDSVFEKVFSAVKYISRNNVLGTVELDVDNYDSWIKGLIDKCSNCDADIVLSVIDYIVNCRNGYSKVISGNVMAILDTNNVDKAKNISVMLCQRQVRLARTLYECTDEKMHAAFQAAITNNMLSNVFEYWGKYSIDAYFTFANLFNVISLIENKNLSKDDSKRLYDLLNSRFDVERKFSYDEINNYMRLMSLVLGTDYFDGNEARCIVFLEKFAFEGNCKEVLSMMKENKDNHSVLASYICDAYNIIDHSKALLLFSVQKQVMDSFNNEFVLVGAFETCAAILNSAEKGVNQEKVLEKVLPNIILDLPSCSNISERISDFNVSDGEVDCFSDIVISIENLIIDESLEEAKGDYDECLKVCSEIANSYDNLSKLSVISDILKDGVFTAKSMLATVRAMQKASSIAEVLKISNVARNSDAFGENIDDVFNLIFSSSEHGIQYKELIELINDPERLEVVDDSENFLAVLEDDVFNNELLLQYLDKLPENVDFSSSPVVKLFFRLVPSKKKEKNINGK